MSKTKSLANRVADESSEDEVNHVSTIDQANTVERKKNQIFIPLTVNGHRVHFQWDTGATCSMVGLDGHEAIGSPPIVPTTCTLRTYNGQNLPVKGKCLVDVKARGQEVKKLPILVVYKHEEMCEPAWLALGR